MTPYSISGATADVLDAEGFDALLAGAADTTADDQLVLQLEGVALPAMGNGDDAFIELRQGDEVLDYPYPTFKFKVVLGSDGQANTEIVFDASSPDEDAGGYLLWHDSDGAAPLPAAEPVESIAGEMWSPSTARRPPASPPPCLWKASRSATRPSRISDVTLKRGVFKATGEAIVEVSPL